MKTQLTVDLPTNGLGIGDCGDHATADVVACLRGRIHSARVADGHACGEMATVLTVTPMVLGGDTVDIYTHCLRKPMSWVVPVDDHDPAERRSNSTRRNVTLNEQVLCLLVRLPTPRQVPVAAGPRGAAGGDRELVAEEHTEPHDSRATVKLERLTRKVRLALEDTSYDVGSDRQLSVGGHRQAAMALVVHLGEMSAATCCHREDPLPEDFDRAVARAIATLMIMIDRIPTDLLESLRDMASDARRDLAFDSRSSNRLYGRIAKVAGDIVCRTMEGPIIFLNDSNRRHMVHLVIGMLVILATELGGATP